MSDGDRPPKIESIRIGEHEVVSLKTILDTLKFMADDENESYLKGQLESGQYENLLGAKLDEWQMRKALAVVVNDAIQKKIEPLHEDRKRITKELNDLLARDDKKKKPKDYFYQELKLTKDLKITSPRVLAKFCLTSEGTRAQWLAENMIQRQFNIKWDTDDGEPDDYSFYDFCDTKKTKNLLKYIPRRAHVKATLYKECRSKQKMLDDLLQMPINSLCPDVFVNTVDGWKMWKAPDKEDKESEFIASPTEDFSWIHRFVLDFITEDAEKQKPDRDSLKKSLEKPTLYWAVVKDSKFKPGEYLKLKEIGQTQVYVGETMNGILGRWINDKGSHCKMMKKCLDNVCAMTTYDPLRLEEILLVDARLALAKVREEKTALFVMKTFGDDSFEKAKIAVKEVQNKYNNLCKAEGLSPSDYDCDTSDESHPARCSQSLRNAWDGLQKAKSCFEPLSEIVEKQLKDEEGYHIEGKRDKSLRRNIIPSNKVIMTWKPKLMGYGMNFKSKFGQYKR